MKSEATTFSKPASIDLVYAGPIFSGWCPDEFRIIAQVSGHGRVSDPIWVNDSSYKTIYHGRISSKEESLVLRFAIEPNSNVFALGSSLHEISIDLGPRELWKDGRVSSAPISLRTTESSPACPQNLTVQFVFAWHIY